LRIAELTKLCTNPTLNITCLSPKGTYFAFLHREVRANSQKQMFLSYTQKFIKEGFTTVGPFAIKQACDLSLWLGEADLMSLLQIQSLYGASQGAERERDQE
jgi:hypothetical protein